MQNNNARLPYLDAELIQALEKRFPPRCPKPSDTEREIWMYVGKRMMIEFLIEQYNQQQETYFEKEAPIV